MVTFAPATAQTTLSPSLKSDINPAQKPKSPLRYHPSHPAPNPSFSQANSSPNALHLSIIKTALDSFFDSILVVNTCGHILQTNGQADQLFAYNVPQTLQPQKPQTQTLQSNSHCLQPLLDEIWRVCTAMIDSQEHFPEQTVVLDSDIAWETEAFRIRVRWMDLEIQSQSCLLVTIEDLQQTAINQVNVDRWKYNLTPREADVWCLKRQGYSYRAIASTLYVTENTVKKHLKNIQAKRREKNGWT